MVAHPSVTEAAVIGYPHKIKGQGIYAFITTRPEATPNDALRDELVQWVRQQIAPIAVPEIMQWTPELPKTRSGKIMRRILRKIAQHDTDELGDISTLANPDVVKNLINSTQSPPGE